MAGGLSSNYDIDYTTDCIECTVPEACCDESCEGRIWVAPCGSIDYATGEIIAINDFCEPPTITAMSHSDVSGLREKQYRGCKKFRRRNAPDFQFTLGFDICQGEFAHAILLGRCSFDYVIAPKGNNLNLELNPSLFNQETKVFWGRIVGDSNTWEYPDDDCQNTSRTYMTDGYCWETGIQAEIPNNG
jgi:hypothetical protein